MRGFFYEVREFFAALFEKSKPQYVGFLRTPTLKDSKSSKKTKCQLGFKK